MVISWAADSENAIRFSIRPRFELQIWVVFFLEDQIKCTAGIEQGI